MDKEGNKTGGRQKGTPNKMTVEIKMVVNKILEFFNEDERMQAILLDVAENKPEVFLSFVAKLAPKDLNISSNVQVSKLSESIERLIDKDNDSISK